MCGIVHVGSNAENMPNRVRRLRACLLHRPCFSRSAKAAAPAGLTGLNTSTTYVRQCPIGAEVMQDKAVSFRVWAPARRGVTVLVESAERGELELSADGDGYF